MGQYAYLINKEKRIRCESHKITGGGEKVIRIEQPEKLAKFIEYCRENKLLIECVSEHYFADVYNNTEYPFNDF